ncbi:S66 peptidase family protein [Robiginitomaculum antarcticum]|uniref:S66 peptidase family protein n=1 Tax=Robiginitomaculum antarcticum TaxID=437507 RepID=UPI00039F395B|nr:LD-carboxypeptidase [Robiginitomaculum antarcticum]
MDIGRRHLMALSGSLAIATLMGAAVPALSQTSNTAKIKPPRLKKGDVVGLVSPASKSLERFEYQISEEVVTALGLVPKRGQYVGKDFGYLAAQDIERAADVNAMFADKSVKAIMAVRGGWGCARILPYLDYDMIRANPKPLIGYSDITALHLALQAKTGLVSFHGPNAASAWGKRTLEYFEPLLFDGAKPTFKNPVLDDNRLVQRKWRTQTITGGKAKGHLIGGNLTVMTALVGTPYMPNTDGGILFLEDVDEAEYRIDRMLTQLGQAGLLSGLKGVVFGQCTSCNTSSGSGFELSEVLEQHFKPLGLPAFHGAFFGHMADQFTIPLGIEAEIDADTGTLRLLEAAVL